jgi:hypothetical protein
MTFAFMRETSQSNKIILFALFIGAIVFYLWMTPVLEEPYGAFNALPYAMYKDKEDYYPKDSALLFSNNKCCKSCCKNLWPLPFDVDDCPTCKDGNEKYVLSNYMCQGEKGAGCVCLDKQEANLLDRRGNNKLVGENVIFPNGAVEPAFVPELKVETVPELKEETIPGMDEEQIETFSDVDFRN